MAAELEDERRAEAEAAEIDVREPLSLKKITKKATHDLERKIILKVLKANNWNRQKTAKWLKISYRSLLYKLTEVEAEDGAVPGGNGPRTRTRPVLTPGEPTNLIQ